MKERPILFSASMVNAILNGSKTVTRRTVKLPNGCVFGNDYAGQIIDTKHQNMLGHDIEFPIDELHCPYGQVGDQLWVRETWAEVGTCDPGFITYKATYPKCLPMHMQNVPKDLHEVGYKWKPSIHMPRWASRIQLEITGVRVERLNDISEEDAKAEGCITEVVKSDYDGSMIHVPKEIPDESGICMACWDNCKDWYADLWETINGAGSWAANPWVWVLEFRRVE